MLVHGFSLFLCVINSCMIIDCPHPCSCFTFISFFFFSFYWWPLPLSSPPPPLPLYPDAPSFIVPSPQEASKTDQFISNWLLSSRDLKPFALRLQDPLRSSETQIRKVRKLFFTCEAAYRQKSVFAMKSFNGCQERWSTGCCRCWLYSPHLQPIYSIKNQKRPL